MGFSEFKSGEIEIKSRSARFSSELNHLCDHEMLSKLISMVKLSESKNFSAIALALTKPRASSGPNLLEAISNAFCGRELVKLFTIA